MDNARCAVFCHVGYDGGKTSEGHRDKFTGVGYEWVKKQARELGWVDTGNRWCCPACANDATPVTTYTIHDEFIGDCVFTDSVAAQEELRNRRDGIDAEEAAQIVLLTGVSTRGQVNQLPEFEP